MAVSKFPRKNQSSIVRVAVASTIIFIIYALNADRTRLADSVAQASAFSTSTSTSTSTSPVQSSEISQPVSVFVHPVQSLTGQIRSFDTATVADAHPPCLPFIFYDKPVKTGSTAVTEALAKYISRVAEPETKCTGMDDCSDVAIETCTGQRERGHLIQHVIINSSVTACLRGKGFYHVTSIREPKARVISAWKYARAKQQSHYGIPWNSTFEEFVSRFPKCALFGYYDHTSHACESKEEVIERAEEIVSRFDEIIDLDEEAISDVHQRIYPFIANVNVASSGRSKSNELQVPDEVVEYEYILYNMLKEKRISLAQDPRRQLCRKAER